MGTDFWWHFCCSISVIFRLNLFKVWRVISLGFAFRSQSLSADDVFPSFVYAVRTSEAATLDTPNEVPILVAHALVKGAPTMRPLRKSDKSPIFQYIQTKSNKTQELMHSHWLHSVQKKKKNKRYNWHQFSAANTKNFIRFFKGLTCILIYHIFYVSKWIHD